MFYEEESLPFNSKHPRKKKTSRSSLIKYKKKYDEKSAKKTKKNHELQSVKAGKLGTFHQTSAIVSSSSIPATQHLIRHEGVNYLQLRRTEESKKAVHRNREVAQEIITPSFSKNNFTENTYKLRFHVQKNDSPMHEKMRIKPPPQPNIDIDEEIKKILKKPTDDCCQKYQQTLISKEKIILKKKFQAARQTQKANKEVEKAINSVRNTISSMYVFTPTFRIWSRLKKQSAMDIWHEFVLWHRNESHQLQLLEHYVVKIQRVFRQRRARIQGRLDRKILAIIENSSVIKLQSWIRGIISCIEVQRMKESKVAVHLQAAWRGKCARFRVKCMLKRNLRNLLRFMSPTGTLHRLKNISIYGTSIKHELNSMLMLLEETDITLYADPNIPEQHYQKLDSDSIIVTRKLLHKAMHNLKEIIRKRQNDIALAKQVFEETRRRKDELESFERNKFQEEALQAAKDRQNEARERMEMHQENLYTLEVRRLVNSSFEDNTYRQKRQQQRNESSERSQMENEDIQTRYVWSRQKYIEEDRKRRHVEIEKIDEWNQIQHIKKLQYMDELSEEYKNKKIKLYNKKKKEKEARLLVWEKKTKIDYEEMIIRVNERKARMEKERIKKEAEDKLREDNKKKHTILLNKRREKNRIQREKEFTEALKMAVEDKISKAMYYKEIKPKSTQNWMQAHEEIKIIAPLDPLNFIVREQDLVLIEKERRESLLMKTEDSTMKAIMRKEAAEKRYEKARLNRLFKEKEVLREKAQLKLMHEEEIYERARLKKIKQKEDYRATLIIMKEAAERDRLREEQRLNEAKSRKLMRDEEYYQRRIINERNRLLHAKEKAERRAMRFVEEQQRFVENEKERIRLREQERKCRGYMSREDITSNKWNILERDGKLIEKVLWEPFEIAVLGHYVKFYSDFLRDNVRIFMLFSGIKTSPLNIHFEELESKEIIKAKRLGFLQALEKIEVIDDQNSASIDEFRESKGKRLWKLGISKVGRSNQMRRMSEQYIKLGILVAKENCFKLARCILLKAWMLKDRSSVLLRALGQCNFAMWQETLNREYLNNCFYFYQKCSHRLELLCSPSFLFEMAKMLEDGRKYKSSAELLGRIVSTFPTFDNLKSVIFRAGIVLMNMRVYDQSRQYLLHVMDNAPEPWEEHEILFMAARILELEGKKKLSMSGYEDSFKQNNIKNGKNKDFRLWKDWLASSKTWQKIGDQYLENKEYFLAQDSYQQAIKRSRRQLSNEVVITDKLWFNLAICQSFLNDRKGLHYSVKKWLSLGETYAERIENRMLMWNSSIWIQLGLEVPQKVQDYFRVDSEKCNVNNSSNDNEGEKFNSKEHMHSKWKEVVDENTGKMYYWNEQTNETSWFLPR